MTKTFLQIQLIDLQKEVLQILADMKVLGINNFDDLHNRAEAVRRAEPQRRMKEIVFKKRNL